VTTATGPVVEDRIDDWVEANHRYLPAALDVVRRRVAGEDTADAERRRDQRRSVMPAPPALDGIAGAFGLSGFERDVLLLCAGVELDAAVARACATAQGDAGRPCATFSLAMAALPGSHWSVTTPAAPLRRWHLVELDHPEVPTASPLRIDERLLHALTGISYLDPRIEVLAEPLPPAPQLTRALCAAADRLTSCWASSTIRRVRLTGRPPTDLRAVVSQASAGLDLQPVRLAATDLPGPAGERDLLARLCDRETALSGRSWLVDVEDQPPDAGRSAVDFAVRLQAPVAVVGLAPAADVGSRLTTIEVAPSDVQERRAAWRAALGPTAPSLGTWVDRLAGHFDVGPAGIGAATEEVRDGLDRADAGPRLWDACRRQARPALDDLAQRIEPRAGWADLVLPAGQARLLREIAVHVRQRLTVFEDWGFAARSARGTGVAALFAGPSGTGKTFAAEVLAADLALDLYRVDLSQVVSKYIGETEKNLRRIFDAAEGGGVVLLFDEADALFGKRSEVKDSHDRYANIEVSYLLQRMETYRGLAILTTNLKSALDSAFLRRLRFVVQFPFPDAAGRAEIWRRIFPAELPTEGLDPLRLARLAVAGGTIRNIALSAAFLAADAGEPVQMSHVLLAARTEYAKLERPLTDAEVAGWTT
jgi:ATPase family protein associated with various cellular activities (AAA)/winged helix domain-containing protein